MIDLQELQGRFEALTRALEGMDESTPPEERADLRTQLDTTQADLSLSLIHI